MKTNLPYKAIDWRQETLILLDQTKLPHQTIYLYCKTIDDVWQAIKQLSVRGAPAIGISAGYGMILEMKNYTQTTIDIFEKKLVAAGTYLKNVRPTAVNLSWAIDLIIGRIQQEKQKISLSAQKAFNMVRSTARWIDQDDEDRCHMLGYYGSKLIKKGDSIITHCNTGGLATGGIGTAFAAIAQSHWDNKHPFVWVDETRPLLQGARLTTWELQQLGIPHSLIVDSAACSLMYKRKINLVITGADRIAANGDTANKIGTYMLAILAHHFDIPFYISAPFSTIDFTTANGEDIAIEERNGEEVTSLYGQKVAPDKVSAYNPAFDVTPAKYITAIITEKGIFYPPYISTLKTKKPSLPNEAE